MENSIVIRYNYSFSRDIISTCILGDEIMKISNFPFKIIFYISFPSIPLRSLEVSVSHAYTTPSPSLPFCFNRDGWWRVWDRRGWNLEKYHGREIKRNGWHDTLVPPSIIHWPDRYVWVCRPCVCARTKTEEGMGGEMSGGDRWNVDGVKRGYKRRGGVESEGRFKTLLRGKDVVRMWGDFECESPTIPGRGCWQNCRICGGRIFPRCIYIYVCVCGNFRKIFL